MLTTQQFPVLSPSDLEFVATNSAGLGWLRQKLGAAGLYGRGLSAQTERCVRAAVDGLSDGWCEVGDLGTGYAGAEREWYLAGLRSATETARGQVSIARAA